ncbi:TPA: hypothetical protein JG917_002222 [Enterobacter hormaechei subsp. steigerwaltii]|nr:hypothetical protein [Enterobacter hormaechei subsp. steigerwaltii]
MATTPTNLPVPSESPRDLKFNAGKIDEFVTSLALQYIDRFGNAHYTIEGLRWMAQQAISQYGWVPIGTFQDGATLTLPNQILKDTTDGEYYRWDGSFLPSGKVVPNGSTPGSTGGVGVGAWISVGDSALRSMLASEQGVSMVGGIAMELDNQADLTTNTTVQGRMVAVKNTVGSYNKYSIIPNSGVLGDGDVIIDRVDGLQGELQIEGVLDVRAFAKTGRTDHQILKAALDYAASKSGHWVVGVTPKDKSGSPWRFNPNLTVGSNTVFQGHGGWLKLNDNVLTDASIAYLLIHSEITSENVWIDSLYIDGNKDLNTTFLAGDVLTISGNKSKVSNCWVINSPDSGVTFSAVNDGMLVNNIIKGGTDNGIYINSTVDGNSRNCVISNNTISDFPVTGIAFLRNMSDAVIDSNSIMNCGNGITAGKTDTDKFNKRLIITNTFMRDIGYSQRSSGKNASERGISIGQCTDVVVDGLMAINVSGNVVYVNGPTDFVLRNATLRGYTASPQSNGNNGVFVDAMASGGFYNVDVSGVANRAGDFSNVTGNASIIGGKWVGGSSTQSGMRIAATCSFNKVIPDFVSGGNGTDIEWFTGATGINKDYISGSASGPARYGYVTMSAGSTTPVGSVTPRFIGQEVWLPGTSKWWKAHGLTNNDWTVLN